MAKKDTVVEEGTEIHAEVDLPNALVLVEPALPVVIPVVEEKKVTFAQYAAGIPSIQPQHIPGLKAFILHPEQLRTHKQWATLLESY